MSTFGIMIQLDGSPHHWFGPKYPPCTLLVFIDDATSKIVWLEFVKSESIASVMRATKSYIEKCGIPLSVYVDYGGVFSVNLNNRGRDKRTQYERAMADLGIEVIHAGSPQAKGRVERSNRTHQDRLVKELLLAKITTMEEANKFLLGYIMKHNSKFAVEASCEGDAHRSVKENLDEIFVVRTTRLLQNDYTVLYEKRILQITNKSLSYKPKDSITISQKLNGELIVSIRGHKLEYEEVTSRPIKVEILRQHKPQIPSKNSRRWNDGGWSPKHYIQQPTYKRGL